MVVLAFYPSTQEAGRSLSSKPAWSTGYAGLHRESLSLKTNSPTPPTHIKKIQGPVFRLTKNFTPGVIPTLGRQSWRDCWMFRGKERLKEAKNFRTTAAEH